MALNVTVTITENQYNLVDYCVTFPNGISVSGSGRSIAAACAEIGAVIYEEADPAAECATEEPSQDDTVHCCPECETPNQFGELCHRCQRDQDEATTERMWGA